MWLCIFWTAGISGVKVKEERLLLLWMRQWKATYSYCKKLYGVVFVCGRCVREWSEIRGQRLNRSEAGRLSFRNLSFFMWLKTSLVIIECLRAKYRPAGSSLYKISELSPCGFSISSNPAAFLNLHFISLCVRRKKEQFYFSINIVRSLEPLLLFSSALAFGEVKKICVIYIS